MIEFIFCLGWYAAGLLIVVPTALLIMKIPSVMEFLERIFSNKQNSDPADTAISTRSNENPNKLR